MAQVNAQDLLRLAEKAGELCFFDIEATNLKGTYGSVLCVAVKPFNQPAKLFSVEHPGLDKTVVREVYFSVVASKMNTARKSQAHVLEALYPNGRANERKMGVSPEEWNKVLNETTRGSAMKKMGARCISDTVGLESLYKRVKHVVVEVNK